MEFCHLPPVVDPLPSMINASNFLSYISLARNNLTSSSVFPWLFNFSSSLRDLEIYNNNLQGPIPNAIGNIAPIRHLHLGDNQLEGGIPSFFGNLTIDVRNNLFNGSLTERIGSLSKLKYLDLGANRFEGVITEAHFFSLSRFTGEIPASLKKCTSLRFADLSENKLSGEIPAWVGDNLSELVLLSLRSNQFFVGEIPTEITSLVTLVGMNLSRDNLSGSLPRKIGELRSLDFLDLSRNHLSGGIPVSLSQLDQLGMFDLSYNNLSGRIPFIAHLQTFESSAYVGNSGLCGPPLTKQCPGDEISQDPKFKGNKNGIETPEQEDKLITRGFYIAMTLGFIVGFWGVYGTYCSTKSWKFAFLGC
ncbi:disease resistance family protein/LRR family protein [Forsythia ovata]|uniref:Disease resistance family protein/LRR family protein n=1 Tax=Forsythia ovata TaxID=205694 RepID=A0ABD1X3A1_9LAMI